MCVRVLCVPTSQDRMLCVCACVCSVCVLSVLCLCCVCVLVCALCVCPPCLCVCAVCTHGALTSPPGGTRLKSTNGVGAGRNVGLGWWVGLGRWVGLGWWTPCTCRRARPAVLLVRGEEKGCKPAQYDEDGTAKEEEHGAAGGRKPTRTNRGESARAGTLQTVYLH